MSNTKLTLANVVAQLEDKGFKVEKAEEFAGGKFLVIETSRMQVGGTVSKQIYTYSVDKAVRVLVDISKSYAEVETDNDYENVKF